MATSSDSRTAEFAKLFDLFELLATRRSRMTVAESTLDDTRSIPVPAELEPVFRSLATVVGTRQPATGRLRRNTVAALGRTAFANDSDASDSESDVESVAKFPLGKTYTFTFKMMIHKLYQVDEWAQKVRDVLKRSQIEYKPLAEQEVKKPAAPEVVTDGRVHFKAEMTVAGKKSMPLARPRSHSVAGVGVGKGSGAAALTRAQQAAVAVQDDARAVKKRCIGRRKSVGGLLPESTPDAPMSGGWIYDAAISLVEVRERAPVEVTTSFPGFVPPRPRYQSLQSGRKKMGPSARRIISAAVSKDGAGVADFSADISAPRIATKRRLSE
ncbi:hypothetical protein B0H10DRAFT_552666 [Mycena sp. CBHHK59/15]|nr:hypothetical protein B0H10DRAFT_552666 [Mycena sp. CBHHK59/15]